MTDYPDGLRVRPIESWPGEPTIERIRSPFSAPWRSTLALLSSELRHLGATYPGAAVLQIALREQDFRITDGMPRANARPAHPGVILSVESQHGPLSYPCDRFSAWGDNLRAIALGLEALRRIDRYGITQGGQQYRGWRAIESTAAATSTLAAAENLIRTYGGVAGEDNALAKMYRRARAGVHPDRRNGDRAVWNAIENAADILRAAGRLS